jgi:hypothetical protein
MRKTIASLAAATVVLTTIPAAAQVLRFDDVPGAITTSSGGVGNGVAIGDFYNGAGGSASDFGVQFVGDARAYCLRRTDLPTCSNSSWGGDPAAAARGTHRAGMLFLGVPLMNRVAGFQGGFSFFYANPAGNASAFEVWSGLNATGTLLASLALGPTVGGAALPNCFGAGYCPFVAAGVTFVGVAQSVRLTGGANGIAYDDITFGSATPGAVIPEPSTVALVASGLAAVGAVSVAARRRRAGGA